LVGVFFADEFIKACPGLVECDVERPPGAVVGMNLERSVGLSDARKPSKMGKGETTDPCPKDCCRDSLAAAGNKIAPTKID
jgi:hypothetical protein